MRVYLCKSLPLRGYIRVCEFGGICATHILRVHHNQYSGDMAYLNLPKGQFVWYYKG